LGVSLSKKERVGLEVYPERSRSASIFSKKKRIYAAIPYATFTMEDKFSA